MESAKDGKTTALLTTPPPSTLGVSYIMDDSLSYEVADAPAVCVPTTLPVLSLAEMRVIALLRDHLSMFLDAESNFRIDRRAIAGAIAWEGLINNKWWTNLAHKAGIGRSVGWGKDHISDSALLGSWGNVRSTWPYEVEKRSLLAPQSFDDRKALLAKPEGAVRYIAAAMDLIAKIYEAAGSPGLCSPSIRNNPVILTNVYNGSTAEKWEAHVKSIASDYPLHPGNDMAYWLAVPRNMTLVEDGVGRPTETFAPRNAR
jgi:hypothetical protein